MTDLSTVMYARALADHYDAIVFWLASNQPALLPWAVIDQTAEPCPCGLVH